MVDQTSNDEKFAALLDKIDKDPAAKKAFGENPCPQIAAAGIPLLPAIAMPVVTQALLAGVGPMVEAAVGIAPRRVAPAEKISVSKHWWGVDIVMNEKLTQDVIDGLTGATPLGGAVAAAFAAAGVITGGVATAIGAGLAAAFVAKIAEIKIIDNGKGVHWPITWVQWAALVAAVPSGPAGIVVAALAFIHPLRN